MQTGKPMNTVNGAFQTGMAYTKLVGTAHTDSTTLLDYFQADQTNSVSLGVLKLAQQFNLLSSPLISMTELQNNVIQTNGFNALLNFQIPYKMSFPKIKENLCGDLVKPGIGGDAFPIVLTEDAFAPGDIITTDYRNGRQLVIENEPVIPYGDGSRYMVKLASYNEVDDYYPPQFLEPGTQYMKIDNQQGEFDTGGSKLSNMNRMGLMNYSYQTGSGEIGIEHWITSNGDMLELGDLQNNPSMQWLNQYTDLSSNKGVMNFYKFDPLTGKPMANTMRWMPTIIMAMQMELAKMKENRLTWGHGTMIQGNGRTKTRVGSGYYPQIKNLGNYQEYSDFAQLPGMLKNMVGTMFAGRRDIPTYQRKVKFRMGMGAMQIMQKEFMATFQSGNPFTIFADHPAIKGSITGSYDNIAYKPIRVTSVQYPEVGEVEIEHDPLLDIIDIDNPNNAYTGMYPNSSYMVFIEDLTSSEVSNAMPTSGYSVPEGYNKGANVVMIKPKNYQDTMGFKVGFGCNPTLQQFLGQKPDKFTYSDDGKGFKVKMMTAGEIYVIDPSKVGLIEFKPRVF